MSLSGIVLPPPVRVRWQVRCHVLLLLCASEGQCAVMYCCSCVRLKVRALSCTVAPVCV